MSNNYLESFIKDNIPGFISTHHPQFKLFLEAYYEYLEHTNTGTSTSVLDLFKELPNPGAIVNNARVNRDIDNTLDGFVDYFRREVIPVAVEGAMATERFTIKKIRDVYLSKGTPKSFQLFFRLLWDNDIEIFEPFDDVIETSEGSYIGFPVSYFKVVEHNERLDSVDIQLSYLADSEDGLNLSATVLSGNIVGIDSDSQIIKAQLSSLANLSLDTDYWLFDGSDKTNYVKIRILPTITNIEITDGGSFYKEGDNLNFYSSHFDRYYDAEVRVAERAPVTHVIVRNRGQNYKKGDMFNFYSNDAWDGKGGHFIITKVDAMGRILEIDGTPVRTGVLNNGFLASTFDDVKVPILNGGEWKTLPSIRYNSAGDWEEGHPYSIQQEGYGAQIIPVAQGLGAAREILFREAPYFTDSDDISLTVARNLVIDKPDGLEVGQKISFQVFRPANNAFEDDSEIDYFQVANYRMPEMEYKKFHEERFIMPIGYDSELFQWKKAEYISDSDHGIGFVQAELDATSQLYVITTHDSDYVYDGGSWTDIAASTPVEGATSFGGFDSDHDFGNHFGDYPGSYLTAIYYNNRIVNQLDSYHFEDLAFAKRFSDSEMTYSYERIRSNPNLGLDSDVGEFLQTNSYARIVGIEGDIVKVMPIDGLHYPNDSDIDSMGRHKYGVVRIAPVDGSGNTVNNTGLELKNVLTYANSFEVNWNIAPVVESSKFFISEDGFLNSPAGGILQDGLRYSNHTYVIKTNVSIDLWRQKVKTVLHPAGKIMFGETVIDQSNKIESPKSVASDFAINARSRFSFSAAQDHWAYSEDKAITADMQLYKVNPFEDGINGLTADSFTNLSRYDDLTQHGNSFWDFEPIGYVSRQEIDYSNYGTFYQFVDSDQWSHVSTQDSDGAGFVKQYTKTWSQYDGSPQDLYKRENRRWPSDSRPVISRTFFRDAVSEKYSVWDSDVPVDAFMRMGDSDYFFKGIDYNRFRSENDTRNWPQKVVPRMSEFEVMRNSDFALAMREDDTFTFTVGDTTYKNIEAYEMKWNTWNDNRTIGPEGGWEIIGWHSHVQNRSNNAPRLRRMDDYDLVQPKFSKIKTPLNYIIWDTIGEEDIWTWNPTYDKEINTITSFNYDEVKQDEQYVTFDYDPEKWMSKHRRTR